MWGEQNQEAGKLFTLSLQCHDYIEPSVLQVEVTISIKRIVAGEPEQLYVGGKTRINQFRSGDRLITQVSDESSG